MKPLLLPILLKVFDNFNGKLFEVSDAKILSTFSQGIVISSFPKPGILNFFVFHCFSHSVFVSHCFSHSDSLSGWEVETSLEYSCRYVASLYQLLFLSAVTEYDAKYSQCFSLTCDAIGLNNSFPFLSVSGFPIV